MMKDDESRRGRIAGAERIRAYVLAGRAVLTILNPATGTRFTYRIRASEPDPKFPKTVYFVDVLFGPNNEADYRYVGFIGERGFFVLGKKLADELARDGKPTPPSVQAFVWFWKHLGDERVEVFHEGRCGKCGRALTVPESIESGLGPVCAQRRGAV